MVDYKKSWASNDLEVRIKICKFGKSLGIQEIIESVSYEKGDKNDIGDEPDDYVVIKLKDGTKVKTRFR